MDLYPYQVRVAQRLRNGTSVLLQAPTGAGKTLAALWPFLEAWDRDDPEAFPRQAIYTVPMRVLANQFLAETHRQIRRLVTPVLPQVTIQTGEQPLDPEFRGDLVFATLDQTLSSLLGVPYSLSTSRSNLNAGAVLGSYLVFDEFHLFPYEATLTVLQLLRHIGRIAPFVLMTATFSSTLLQRVADLLRASGVNVETLVVSPEEAHAIATRDHRPPKERRFYVEDAPLVDPLNETHQAHSILDRHNRRSLVVLNTVGRAQTLYEALLAAGARGVPFSSLVTREEYETALQASLHIKKQGKDPQNPWAPLVERVREYLLEHADVPWVMLLHSRFEAKHRRFKEELLRALWGPKGLQKPQPSLIVIATQVVEVGLHISAEVLHTESAPAAAVLQRAGRCARYPGEKGQVYVYPVPLQANGAPNYKPYRQPSNGKRASARGPCSAGIMVRSWAFRRNRPLSTKRTRPRTRPCWRTWRSGRSGKSGEACATRWPWGLRPRALNSFAIPSPRAPSSCTTRPTNPRNPPLAVRDSPCTWALCTLSFPHSPNSAIAWAWTGRCADWRCGGARRTMRPCIAGCP